MGEVYVFLFVVISSSSGDVCATDVCISKRRTASGRSVADIVDPSRWIAAAAKPATCGDAILVPLKIAYEPSLVRYVLKTVSPNEVTSGLILVMSATGPLELNSDH
ncbi:hypothetical protein BDF19DRAFT_429442 [Syncephalis fuscata]|nr:hypothetical protein BDF19DRAFT_429442 [Syncephalis fuscata]